MPIPPMMIPMLAKAGLGIMQGLGQQGALDPYADKYNKAMKLAGRYARNPSLMYQRDPALLDMRRMRMGNVQSRQLARTGGTLGGNYGRTLQREGAGFDQAALQNAINTQLQLAQQYAPYAQQQASMGGLGGILGGVGQGAMSDIMFSQFLGGMGGGMGGGATAGPNFITPTGAAWEAGVSDAGFTPTGNVVGPQPY